MLKEIKILTLFAVCGFASPQTGQLYGNPDGIVFPGDINARSNEPKISSPRLSLKLAKTLNSLNSVEEFLKMVDGMPEENRKVFIQSRFGEEERSNGIPAVPAKCMPELQAVSFYQEDRDPSIVYWPSCTRIKRCGGCCTHVLLSCQPTESVTKNFEVMAMKINPNGEEDFVGKEIVPLEEHTKCKCDCRIKPEHCTGKQKYNEEECSCTCMNEDEAEKCRRLNDTKLWDPMLCACRCREERDCTTGSYFDPVTCRCERQRWFSTRRGTAYDVTGTSKSRDSTSPVIVPFGSDNRRRQNKDDPEYK